MMYRSDSFKNTRVVVSGATGLIGSEICKMFLLAGANVIAIGSSEKRLHDLRLKLNNKNLEILKCNLLKQDQIAGCIEKIKSQNHQIDVLINSAGILEKSSIDELSHLEWDRIIRLNLTASFLLIQGLLGLIRESANGRIINISSNAGRMGGYNNGPAYAASKGGLISMTYNLARKLGKDNITVNVIAPGTIESPMNDIRSKNEQKELLKLFPSGRFGTAEEIAHIALFLASKQSSFVNGSVIDANGGMFTG